MMHKLGAESMPPSPTQSNPGLLKRFKYGEDINLEINYRYQSNSMLKCFINFLLQIQN